MVTSRFIIAVFLLSYIVSFALFSPNADAAPKPHKITVGMFNTYSMKDGNLGSREPDLKEVWTGASGVSEYEACNMTMHYWPRPFDLPDVGPGENPYSAWWKSYMEEAYNLTNQNGEVRLRVIVGALYSYYEVYKGEVFDGFIKDLCNWEKGSKYEGTLAGWYLAEEPWGSAHNYDSDVCNEMARNIKAIEKSLGVREHPMYIDVTITGKYYSSASLAEFTRMVDVVMVSANPFLWTTSGQQPVYETPWKRIHQSTKEARKVIYADRDRRKAPYPEIHVVLEARDAIGYGQPTNWEMRQQIHESLSYNYQYDDPPVDGIWFFWWSEIGRNRKNDVDDWNHGRRIAEAIQVQVPRSTLPESSGVKSSADPAKTGFTFSEYGSFNPNNSCIPYNLAEPGYVQIQILNEKMSLIKTFDMKYQVSGSLGRFGGPYWRRSVEKNGNYIFRLYHNSKLIHEVKKKVQWSLMLNSTSHQMNIWSRNNLITVQWDPISDDVNGIRGYSIVWDSSVYTYPDDQIELLADLTETTSPPLPDGDNYFHILTLDNEGKQVSIDHLGPFYIDTTSPDNVKALSSSSHEIEKWSNNNRIILRWNPAEDEGSGIKGYSILWDNSPGTIPDEKVDISGDLTFLASEPLRDGEHYFHIRSVDNAENWSNTTEHIGPFLIDRSRPGGVKELVSISHIPGQWSNKNIVSLTWKEAEDVISGIRGYSTLWDNNSNTVPEKTINMDKKTMAISPVLESSREKGYYFHIVSLDMAGNWSNDIQHIGPFMIDAEPPDKIRDLESTSHKSEQWWNKGWVDLRWDLGEDRISGIAGYEWCLSSGENPSEDWKTTLNPFLHISNLQDGIIYVHVRALDNAGNKSESGYIAIKIDKEPPSPPDLWSYSHPVEDIWYTNPEVSFEWISEDKISGVKGYSYQLDANPLTIPPEVNKTEALSIKLTVIPGVNYFHIRSVDKSDNWSSTRHYKIQYDPSAPPSPRIVSDTHISGKWNKVRDVKFTMETYNPGLSGVSGYSYLLDQNPHSIPEEVVISNMGRIDYEEISDGIWYFHCRAKSGSGIWGDVAHFELKVDSTPPRIDFVYPQDNRWYNHSITQYAWTMNDNLSGIDSGSLEYSFNNGPWIKFACDDIKQSQDFVSYPDYWGDSDDIPDSTGPEDILQIRLMDNAGNMGISKLITIKVDTVAASPVIISTTHPNQDKWYSNNSPKFAWDFEDRVSGVDSYSWSIDNSENTVPPEVRMIEGDIISKSDIGPLSDGIWYFHLRARDKAGNWSEASHYRLKIDLSPPKAQIKLSGPSLIRQAPPLLRPGPIDIFLQTSELVENPVLEYLPANRSYPVPLKLVYGKSGWESSFNVNIRTGDGKGKFIFSGKDRAGNIGKEITSGEIFIIDTFIHKDSDENSEILCVSEPGTKVLIKPGSISQDIRVEILKSFSNMPNVFAIYDFIPYDLNYKIIKDLRFIYPAELSFSIQGDQPLGLYYWDGVKWHKVQDVDKNSTVKVDYLGRFALMKSEAMASGIMYGWATPNPFTPNGRGDVGDRVIFNVSRQYEENFHVKIYDINGRLIKHLDDGIRVWDGTDKEGKIVEGGLYIYQIQSSEQIISGTIVVLK